jgi:hypothetical protein
LKITLVIELLDRRVGWETVGEVVGKLERADARLDLLRSVLAGRHEMVTQWPSTGSTSRS